jgi:hypothetical protein
MNFPAARPTECTVTPPSSLRTRIDADPPHPRRGGAGPPAEAGLAGQRTAEGRARAPPGRGARVAGDDRGR